MVLFQKISFAIILALVFVLSFYAHFYLRLGFAIALVVVLCSDVINKRTFRVTWQEVMLFLIMILAAIYVVLNKSYAQSSASNQILSYGTPFLLLLCIRRVWRKNYEWFWLGYSYLTGCVVSTTLLIQNWISGVSGFDERLTVGEINANFVSYSLATGVAIGLILTLFPRSKVSTNLLALVIVFLSAGIILSGTRGAIISVLAVLFVYYSLQVGRRPFKLFLSLVTTITIGIILFSIIPEEITSRLLNKSTDDVSSGRYDLWSSGLSLVLEKPIAGYGIDFFPSQISNGLRVHNVFIDVLIEFGLIGFILYSTVMFSLIFMKDKRKEIKRARLLFIVSWLPIAMTGAWEFSVAPWFVFAWLSRMPASFES